MNPADLLSEKRRVLADVAEALEDQSTELTHDLLDRLEQGLESFARSVARSTMEHLLHANFGHALGSAVFADLTGNAAEPNTKLVCGQVSRAAVSKAATRIRRGLGWPIRCPNNARPRTPELAKEIAQEEAEALAAIRSKSEIELYTIDPCASGRVGRWFMSGEMARGRKGGAATVIRATVPASAVVAVKRRAAAVVGVKHRPDAPARIEILLAPGTAPTISTDLIKSKAA